MLHDLVVIIPGIMGSALLRDGRDVWDLSPDAIKHLLRGKRALDTFMLPEGIGDEEPDPEHALTVGGLVRGPRILPGLVSHLGYSTLRDRIGVQPERLAVFTYDWRLSNRRSAEKLKSFVERRLTIWREKSLKAGADVDEAKVIFIARSMGGLIAKYYIERLGGREVTRALVTLGTPHQGAVKALRFLVGAPHGMLPSSLREHLAAVCRTFPSLHQLLPVYRCVIRPELGEREDLDTVDIPGIETRMVRDAFAFHREIRDAQGVNHAMKVAPYRMLALGGGTHPTVHGVSLAAGRLAFLNEFPEPGDWIGDGTVPQISATPREYGDTGCTMWFPYRHAALAGENTVLLQLRAVCNSHQLKQVLATPTEFGVEIPDVVVAGKPLVIKASPVERGQNPVARLVASDGSRLTTVALHPVEHNVVQGEIDAPPGLWTVEVELPNEGVVHRDAVLVVEA